MIETVAMTAKLAARVRAIALAAMLPSLAGCQAAFFKTLELASDADGVRTETRVYDSAHDLAIDLYCPRGRTDAPMLVFFYGGSWEDGHREWYAFVGRSLAARGIAVAIPDYRVYPAVRFPVFVEDAAHAVAWARSHAVECGAAPARLHVGGHSAGAHLAALVATDARYLATVGLKPRDLAGVVGIAGPYDFLPITDQTLKVIFGPVDTHPGTQPVTFVDGDEPPFLLLHGDADGRVWPRNSERLAAKLEENGIPVEYRRYAGVGHVKILAAMARGENAATPTLVDVVRFVEQENGTRSINRN